MVNGFQYYMSPPQGQPLLDDKEIRRLSMYSSSFYLFTVCTFIILETKKYIKKGELKLEK